MSHKYVFEDREYELTENEEELLKYKISEVEPNTLNLRPEVVESKLKEIKEPKSITQKTKELLGMTKRRCGII